MRTRWLTERFPGPRQLLAVFSQCVTARPVECVQQWEELGQGRDAVCADGHQYAPLLQKGQPQDEFWEQQAGDTWGWEGKGGEGRRGKHGL